MKARKQTKKTDSYKVAPLELDLPRLTAGWVDEPALLFADNHEHVDPKTGIPLYGPRSLGTRRHQREVHVGFIGTSESVELARRYYDQASYGVDGDDHHAPFPGCRSDRGFRCDLLYDNKLVELITRSEHQDILGIKRSRERFEKLLLVLELKMRLLTQRDHPLDYVVLALPTDLYQRCRAVDFVEKGVGHVHRDLRRAFKAMAMVYQKPTQILLESTTGLTDSKRDLDHPSVVAWNLFTGLYFKIDGLPWGPTGLPPGSCFIGVSFFRPLGESSTLRTSVVQAFDENGEGLVLRGHRFDWDDRKGKSPHLTADMAESLIEMVMQRYQAEQKQLPKRVVIHKTSRYESLERSGFEGALKSVAASTTWCPCRRRAVSGCCGRGSTRRCEERFSRWGPSATCTRPATCRRSASTRTATSRRRSRSPIMWATRRRRTYCGK